MGPATRNVICGHSSRSEAEDLYIHLSDEELLKAVDSMTFDHGWTQLDTVAHAEPIFLENKSDAKMTPFLQQKKKGQAVA
jgi:hypothetical protein